MDFSIRQSAIECYSFLGLCLLSCKMMNYPPPPMLVCYCAMGIEELSTTKKLFLYNYKVVWRFQLSNKIERK